MIKINEIYFGRIPTFRNNDDIVETKKMDLDAIRDYVECKIEKMLEGVNLKTSSTYSKTRFEEMDFEDRALEIIKMFHGETHDVEYNFDEYYVFVCDCEIDENKSVVALKLNPKKEIQFDGNYEECLVSKNCLPNMKSVPNDGFIIDFDGKTISVLEKKVKYFNGDKGFLIADRIFMGSLELQKSPKQVLDTLYKVVNQVNKEYGVFDIETKPVVDKVIYDNEDINGIKAFDVARKVFENDTYYDDAIELLNLLDVHEDDMIPYIDFKKLSKVKLKLDDDQTIEMSIEDYVDRDNGTLEIKDDNYGHKQVIINNILEVKVKK